MSTDLTNQYLTFYLDNEQYALRVGRVREVLEMVEPSRLPHMPSYMEGVINVRDAVLPVVDMRRRLRLSEGERTIDTAIVVMELSDTKKSVGCLVDAVDAVVEIEPSQIEPAPQIGTAVNSAYLEGIAKRDGDTFVMLLDPDALFGAEDLDYSARQDARSAG